MKTGLNIWNVGTPVFSSCSGGPREIISSGLRQNGLVPRYGAKKITGFQAEVKIKQSTSTTSWWCNHGWHKFQKLPRRSVLRVNAKCRVLGTGSRLAMHGIRICVNFFRGNMVPKVGQTLVSTHVLKLNCTILDHQHNSVPAHSLILFNVVVN